MEIDWSIVAFEILNFGILVVILRRFLFRPVQAAIEKRREEIEHIRVNTEQRQAQAVQAREAYEGKLHELDEEAQRRIDAALAQGREEAGRILDTARAEGRRLAAATVSELENARRLALEDLRRDVIELAADAAQRIVAHTGAPSVARAYARKGAQALLDALDGRAPTETLALAVSPDADPAEIEAEVRQALETDVEIEITSDPEIVAGVRLRCDGHEIEASASSTLRRWHAAHHPDGAASLLERSA
jgi:F-type H+-transporting ATPase subunit b